MLLLDNGRGKVRLWGTTVGGNVIMRTLSGQDRVHVVYWRKSVVGGDGRQGLGTKGLGKGGEGGGQGRMVERHGERGR